MDKNLNMILAIDVHYRDTFAKAVGVLFNWDDEHPQKIITTIVDNVDEYIPGEFYKRELPSVLKNYRESRPINFRSYFS